MLFWKVAIFCWCKRVILVLLKIYIYIYNFPEDFPVQCCSLISSYSTEALHLKRKPHMDFSKKSLQWGVTWRRKKGAWREVWKCPRRSIVFLADRGFFEAQWILAASFRILFGWHFTTCRCLGLIAAWYQLTVRLFWGLSAAVDQTLDGEESQMPSPGQLWTIPATTVTLEKVMKLAIPCTTSNVW